MIEVYELQQFTAFTEYRTLSEAAEILHLSQPALSRSMKKLEEDLGISLFIRKKQTGIECSPSKGGVKRVFLKRTRP